MQRSLNHHLIVWAASRFITCHSIYLQVVLLSAWRIQEAPHTIRWWLRLYCIWNNHPCMTQAQAVSQLSCNIDYKCFKMCNLGYWSRTAFKWWYIVRSIIMIICELIWLLPISYSVNVCAGPRVDSSIFLRSNISSLQWIIYCYCHMMGDNNVAPTACH